MAQVIVCIGRLNMGAPGGSAPIIEPNGAKVDEIATSGTATTATPVAADGDYAVITNVGSTLIWVRFNGTAAVEAGCPVLPESYFAFGPLAAGAQASVIDDS